MKEELINKAYEIAKERYAAVGVDTEKVMETMQNFHLSLHCWQADDVTGFEVQAGSLTGGIQATGNYPGKARNIDELRADILKAASYIPGTHRLNLHEIYGDFQGKVVDRDEVEPEHFKSWIEWGKENNMKLDFNSTSFSHPKSGDLSLSNPDEGIRNFWIEHTKRCRAVAEEMGKAQGDPCIMNLWVHDGSKDITVNRMKYRALLKDSLDQIFATEYKNMKDCIESKVFGIGLESYTVGSNDFYIGYGAKNNKMITLDTGHFHPTESVADKVSSLLLYVPELMLHVSRPVRWDSDHVTIMDDPTMDLFSEIVRCNALDRVHYGLDYFDASINRIGAYVIGSRAAQKCMVRALLEPIAKLREYEANGQGFQRLALLEEEKALPWNAVWDMFCLKNRLLQGVFAWLVFPLLGALLGIPQGSSLFDLWGTGGAPMSIFYGILWGVGGLTFGLSMRYLGVALGQSIALGTCAGFGTLFPAIFAGTNLFEGNGLILLLGVCITLSGIAIIGYAGSLRAKNMSEEEKRAAVKDFALTKGLLVALLAGVMSACFALGLDAGTPIKEAALAGGVEGLYAGLPVIFLVTLGGFLTNAVYCLQQNIANKTMSDYAKSNVWGNNLIFCALAGVLWYMQFFGLEMGKSFLTGSPVLLAFSWCILMALNVTFSNVWGILLKEWKGVSTRTITVLITGLVVLIFSLVFPNLF